MNLIENVPPMQLLSKLSIDDILYLQEMFLTKGLHHIMVPDIFAGRTLVHSFLQSMHYFHEVSCLTNDIEQSLVPEEYNLLENLTDFCGQEVTLDTIEEYFLEHYCADFMWIELSEALMSNPLVAQIAYIMHTLDIAHRMPVIAVSYKSIED
jgi:hypothetical protein